MNDKYLDLLNAAKTDNVEEIKKLLVSGAIPDYVIYDNAGEAVKKLFKYRPGRKNPTIYDYISNTGKYPNDFGKNNKIKCLLADYDDTSSDESSDDEF